MAWVAWRRLPPKVEVVQVRQEQLAEVLALSGRIRGRFESRLAPEISGTLVRIVGEEGQRFKRGQLLAQLDNSRLLAQRRQAQERVAVARAQVELASRAPLDSQLQEVRAQVRSQQQVSQAALESAQQRWLEARRGPRAEQVAQARANLGQAEAEAQQKLRESERLLRLFDQGAISQQSLEQAETAARSSRRAVESAQARWQELRNGTRPEQLEQARQSYRSAQAEWQAAQVGGEAKIQQLLDQPRQEDRQLALAQLGESQAALEVAQRQVQQSEIRAPYSGVVGRHLLKVGDNCGPSQPVLTFSSYPELEVRVDVDESERARLKEGQRAEVRAQGFPQGFPAQLVRLGSEVDGQRGTLEVRLRPLQIPQWALPGQTVDVNLILGGEAPRLLLPLTCVVLKGEEAEVVVIEAGVAHVRRVEVSNPLPQGYLIHQGLREREVVALYPQGLKEGQQVRADAL